MYNTDLPMAEFDEEGLSTKAGWAKVYRANGVTGEYIGHADMDNVPYRAGLAADAYLDAPEIPSAPNLAVVRSSDGKSWLHVPDYRGCVVYDKETKQQAEISGIGELPDNLTLDAPKTPFDKWSGKKWVTDKAEQQASEVAVAESQKQSLLTEAEQAIAMLERKIRLGMATDEDKAKLNEWEIYSVKMSNVDTSTAPDIAWPVKP